MSLEQVQRRISPTADSTLPRWRKPWRSMPDPAIILPAPPEEVYPLMAVRTTSGDTIRRRIDLFCRAISDRAFAAKYRQALLTVHRGSPRPELPAGLPSSVELMRMAAACPDDHAGLRDRALLLLQPASGLGPAALMALDVDHIRFAETAAELAIDTKRGVYRISVPCCTAPILCPVQALRDWLHTSDIRFGPVFCRISQRGKVGHRLTPAALWKIVHSRREKLDAMSKSYDSARSDSPPREKGAMPQRRSK
jgi:hypothetical protein